MPHLNVAIWPGHTEAEKQDLTRALQKTVAQTLHMGEEYVGVSFEEIAPEDWDEYLAAQHRSKKFYAPGK